MKRKLLIATIALVMMISIAITAYAQISDHYCSACDGVYTLKVIGTCPTCNAFIYRENFRCGYSYTIKNCNCKN